MRLQPQTNFTNEIPKNFNKVYDYDHLKERLYIHWDILTKCNFDCSYCYAKRSYSQFDEWQKIDNFNKQKLVIKSISKSTLPVFLGLLGGEPTLHPKFFEILEEIHKEIIPKNDENRLYITTNGSTNIFKNLKYYPKTYILWSIHLEFKNKYGKNFEKVFENIEMCISKGFKNRVNFLLLPDEKYYDNIHFIFEKLKSLNVEIHPHFLYNDPCEKTSLFNYNDNFFNEFKELNEVKGNFVFENDNQYTILNDYTIFKNKLNKFKGWKCYNNNYEISWDGKITNICKYFKTDIIKNFKFFENIKSIDPMICPYNECNCDGLLKVYKEKI